MKSGKVTLSEIARLAETSTMAVSVVLNGSRSNTRVSEDTRKRDETMIAEILARPKTGKRSLCSCCRSC